MSDCIAALYRLVRVQHSLLSTLTPSHSGTVGSPNMPRKRGLSQRCPSASRNHQKLGAKSAAHAAARDAAAAARQLMGSPPIGVAPSITTEHREAPVGAAEHQTTSIRPAVASRRRTKVAVKKAYPAVPRAPGALDHLSRRFSTAQNRYHPYRRDSRQEAAARRQQQRAQQELVQPFNRRAGKNIDQALSAMAGALRTPDLRPHLSAIGVVLAEEAALDSELVNNITEQVGGLAVGCGEKRRGGSKKRQSEVALDVLLTSIVPATSPARKRHKRAPISADEDETPAPPGPSTTQQPHSPSNRCQTRRKAPIVPPAVPVCSPGGTLQSPPRHALFTYKSVAKRLGMSEATGRRRLSNAIRRKKDLTSLEKRTYLGDIRKRCNKRKITDAVAAKVSQFVLEHRHVRPSPISSDTVLIHDSDHKKTIRVGKLLCEIGLQQLYLEFLELNPEMRGVLGERSFRYMMPPQMRRMAKRYMSMCGCKICTEFHGLHRALVVNRGVRASKARSGGPDFTPSYSDHDKPQKAVDQATCSAVLDGYPAAKCWLNRCILCKNNQQYVVSADEDRNDVDAPTITYSLYEYHPSSMERWGAKLEATFQIGGGFTISVVVPRGAGVDLAVVS